MSIFRSDNSQMHGDSQMFDNSRMFDNSQMFDNSRMFGDSQMFDNSRMFGDSQMHNNSQMFDNSQIHGDSRMHGDSRLYGDSQMYNNSFTNKPHSLWTAYFQARTGVYPLTLCLRGTPENIEGVNWSWGCKHGKNLRIYLEKNEGYEDLKAPIIAFLEGFEKANNIE